MPRVKTTLLLDPEFKEFLEHLKNETGAPISRIVEIATLEKYQKEYRQFKKDKAKTPKETD